MNWETYNSMTATQKEEYDFRFRRKRKELNFHGFLPWATVFMLTSVMIVFVSYLIIANPTVAEQIGVDNVSTYFNQATFMVGVVMFLIIISVVVQIGTMGWSTFKEHRWISKNNVKRKGGLLKWLT